VSDDLLKLPSDWDSKGFPWGKMKAIEALFEQLPDITHAFWLDADIVLTNLRVGLEWLALLDYSFVTCGDENGINTGAFLMRNDAFSRNLLRRTWGLYPSFASHPWFEQGAMIGIIMSNLSATGPTGMSSADEANLALDAFHAATMMADTPACIARLNAKLSPSSKNFALLVPQCLFGRRADTWAPGSFAVHFAGSTREDKVRLFLEYVGKVLRDDSLVKTVALPPISAPESAPVAPTSLRARLAPTAAPSSPTPAPSAPTPPSTTPTPAPTAPTPAPTAPTPAPTAPIGRPAAQSKSSPSQITVPVDPAGGNEESPCGSTRPYAGGGVQRPFRCADALDDVVKSVVAKAPSRKPVKIAVVTIVSG
jgi:hypothetical protein